MKALERLQSYTETVR